MATSDNPVPKPTTFTFILTEGNGARLYCAVLLFYELDATLNVSVVDKDFHEDVNSPDATNSPNSLSPSADDIPGFCRYFFVN